MQPLKEEGEPRWLFVPVSEHLRVNGVKAAARVGDYAVTSNIGGREQTGRLLGVARAEFPAVAYFRNDVANRESLGGLMNRLALNRANILVSREFLERNTLKIGDPLKLAVNAAGDFKTIDFTVAGVLDLFPTLADYCRLKPPSHALDGRNLRPLLNDPQGSWDRPAITTYGEGYFSADAPAPEWNTKARGFQAESRSRRRSLEESLAPFLSDAEREEILACEADLLKASPDVLAPLIALIAEEMKYFVSLEKLVQESTSARRREEAYGLILEKIQPPLGIVTHIPRALFFPCLKLLLDERIDPGSGIPYLASLILSVFQDPRSAEPMLRALESYPRDFTKIRENVHPMDLFIDSIMGSIVEN